MKRQRGRNRGGNSGGGGSGGGGKPSHNANRAFDSNGPDGVKIRGHAQHVYEKYQQLARDATGSGDRVLAENYLQHAEHYYRVLRTMQPTRPYTEIVGRDGFSSNFDIDFEDETGAQAVGGEEGEAPSGEGQPEFNGGDQNRDRNDNGRSEGRYESRDNREYRPENRSENQGGRQENREYRPEGQNRSENRSENRPENRPENREGGRQDNGPPRSENQGGRSENRESRGDRQNDRQNDRPNDRQGGDRQRFEGRRDFGRDERPRYGDDQRRNGDEGRSDPLAVVEPQATPLTGPGAESDNTAVLRDRDGGVSHAPAFLQAASAPEEGAAPKAPRKRKPKAEAPTEA